MEPPIRNNRIKENIGIDKLTATLHSFMHLMFGIGSTLQRSHVFMRLQKQQ
jgi:hypothetical protein